MDWMELGQKWRDEQKRVADNGKIADSIVRANPDMLQSLGTTPEGFSALSARDKANAVTGVFQAAGYKKALLDLQNLKVDVNQKESDLEHAGSAYGLREQQARGLQLRNDDEERSAIGWQNLGKIIGNEEDSDVSPFLKRMVRSGVPPKDALETAKAAHSLRSFTPGDPVPLPGTDYFRVQTSPEGYTTVPGVNAKKNLKEKSTLKYPWEISENDGDFQKGLEDAAQQSPDEVDGILARRRKWRLATGTMTPQEEKMMWISNGGKLADYYKAKAEQSGKPMPSKGAEPAKGSGNIWDQFQAWRKGRK